MYISYQLTLQHLFILLWKSIVRVFATLPVYMHLFVVHERERGGEGWEREREREWEAERERERERQRRVTSSWGEIKQAEAARAHNGFANESTFRWLKDAVFDEHETQGTSRFWGERDSLNVALLLVLFDCNGRTVIWPAEDAGSRGIVAESAARWVLTWCFDRLRLQSVDSPSHRNDISYRFRFYLAM